MGFDITGLGSVFDFLSKGIDKLFPDKDAADKVKLEMLKLAQAGEFKELELQFELAKAQIGTNTEEAKSSNMFVAGWRPAVGWTCVSAYFWNFVLMPMLAWGVELFWKVAPKMIALDTSELGVLLFGMLGIGGMRSFDKLKAVK